MKIGLHQLFGLTLFFNLLLLFAPQTVHVTHAQDPDESSYTSSASTSSTWAKTYWGRGQANGGEFAKAVDLTSDGGYVVAGDVGDFGAGGTDVWVVKLDGAGNILWQKSYGSTNNDSVSSIRTTADGGYIFAGTTPSLDAAGSVWPDAWVVKLDGLGNILWQKSYRGNADDYAYFILPTTDGGYAVAGSTRLSGYLAAWVLKLDGNGEVVWQKVYGGVGYFGFYQNAYSLVPALDGGYVVAGVNAPGFASYGELWVFKLDSSGNLVWQKNYDGAYNDEAHSLVATPNGGYIVAGYAEGFGNTDGDFWLLELDGSGEIIWQKTYGQIDQPPKTVPVLMLV